MDRFHFSQDAIWYSWRQLARRAGIAQAGLAQTGFEVLGLPVHYGMPKQFQGPGLIVCRCEDEAWMKILQAEPNTLHWVPAAETVPANVDLPFQNPVPVLFWGKGFETRDKPFAERRPDGSVLFYADIVASVFFMLSRWEETIIPVRDEHGRFPSHASTAAKQSFLHLPVVDQYAMILHCWLKVLLPEWQPVKNVFSIKLSHDIDHVSRFTTALELLSKIGGDLLNRRSLSKALETMRVGLTEWLVPSSSPEYKGILHLAEISRRHHMTSAFFFKASDPSLHDSGYSLKHYWLRTLMAELREHGFEIGFHPGYMTFRNAQLFQKEKERLIAASGMQKFGGRQHYLRFQVPDTWRVWERAGLTYDSSMAYADENGFRCGTCHPFCPFDIEQNREMTLVEYPLIVMEGTLKKKGLSISEAHDVIIQLARRCLEVNGNFTLLWHNTSLQGDWLPWVPLYEALISELAALKKEGESLV